MSMMMSLERLTRFIVNIDEKLFRRYETGITAHFAEYLKKNHEKAITGDQVDLEALGTGIQALRINYMKKNSADYSAQDSAEFILSGHNLYTAEFMSVNAVKQMIEGYYHDPLLIGNVYIKRSATTGRLIPCVNREFVEALHLKKEVTEGVERQLQEIQKMLENYEYRQQGEIGFEQYRVANLIAEKTAEIIMKKMNYSRAV